MKIAVITSTYPRYKGDSVGSFIHSLSQSLKQLGHEVEVLAPYDPEVVPDWQSNVDVKRIRYIRPDSWSRLGHARSLASDVRLKWHAYPLVALFTTAAVLSLWNRVIRQRPDIIYAHWLVPGGFAGAIVSWLTGTPLVVSLHGSDVFVAERYTVFRPAVRFIFGVACHVIACSTDLASRAVALGLPRGAFTVVPYGVDTDRYAPSPHSAQAARDDLGIAQSQRVVMVLGRLVYKKGFSYFLKAIPSILNKHYDTQFIVAGDGDLRSELQDLARLLHIQEHVFFTGQIPWDRTPDYLAMADIFVVPSVLDEAGNLDGLPNVVLESMASGCAIVATKVAGIPEVVQNGKNGLLVSQKNEQELADAICRLLSDAELRHRLGVAARETVTGKLDWIQVGERVAVILQACQASK
jgi:glycosyltransferase involved in cell wall biosynthesis